MKTILILTFLLVTSGPVMAQTALEQAFELYKGNENLIFNKESGRKMWNKVRIDKHGKQRDCNTCHGKDLTKSGKHIKTSKEIEPMAPSVNDKRLTKLKKIKKWLKRNCKWTFGRECTNQEKGDFLIYLSQL